MSRKAKLLQKALDNPKGLRFEEVCRLAEYFGFEHKGGRGNHRVYIRSDTATIMNFQSVNGEAKPYQVKQLLEFIDENGLAEDAIRKEPTQDGEKLETDME
jgi:hypothetical protein